jgi:hypothetical protein
MTSEAITHVLIGTLELVLLILMIRQLTRSLNSYMLLATAVIAGLVYDNYILAFGAQIGFGPLLQALNVPRFYVHALLTPTLIIFAIGVARWVGMRWAQSKLWHAAFCILATAMILLGSYQDIVQLTLEPYDVVERGLTGYSNAYVMFRGPPIPAVVAILVLIVVGVMVAVRARWVWMLLGALFMFVGAALGVRQPLIANIGELTLALGLTTTALAWAQGVLKRHTTRTPAAERVLSGRDLEIRRKERMRIANIFMGWAVLLGAIAVTWSSNPALFGPAPDWMANLGKSVYFIGIFLHAFASVYLYGVPTLKPNIRVIDMYSGFAVFGVILINRTLVNVPALADITWLLMWLPITLHLLLGLWFATQRVTRKTVNPRLKYYLGGNVVRDATR